MLRGEGVLVVARTADVGSLTIDEMYGRGSGGGSMPDKLQRTCSDDEVLVLSKHGSFWRRMKSRVASVPRLGKNQFTLASLWVTYLVPT